MSKQTSKVTVQDKVDLFLPYYGQITIADFYEKHKDIFSNKSEVKYLSQIVYKIKCLSKEKNKNALNRIYQLCDDFQVTKVARIVSKIPIESSKPSINLEEMAHQLKDGHEVTRTDEIVGDMFDDAMNWCIDAINTCGIRDRQIALDTTRLDQLVKLLKDVKKNNII